MSNLNRSVFAILYLNIQLLILFGPRMTNKKIQSCERVLRVGIFRSCIIFRTVLGKTRRNRNGYTSREMGISSLSNPVCCMCPGKFHASESALKFQISSCDWWTKQSGVVCVMLMRFVHFQEMTAICRFTNVYSKKIRVLPELECILLEH